MFVPGSFDGSGIAISLTTRGKLIKIRIYSRGGEKKKEKKKKPPLHVLLFIVGRLVTSVARDACNVICRGSLFPDSEQSPAVYLRDDPLFGSLQLQQHSELRAPTAERAAFYLDAAVAGRQREDGDAHMLYTLHVYQYSVAGKGGGERNPPFSPPSLPLPRFRSRPRVASGDLGLRRGRDQPPKSRRSSNPTRRTIRGIPGKWNDRRVEELIIHYF